MHPFLLIFILIVLCVGEASSPTLVDAPWRRLAGVASLLAGHIVLLELSGRRLLDLLHRWPQHADRWGQRLRWLQSTHHSVWAMFSMLLLSAMQWHHLALDHTSLRDVPLLGDLLLLAPMLIPLVWNWSVQQRFQATVERLISEHDEPSPYPRLYTSLARCERPWHIAWRRQCLNTLAPILTPLLVVFAIGDCLKPLPQASDTLRTLQWMAPILLLGAIATMTPLWLGHLWTTKPLEAGPLRNRLESLSQRLDLHVHKLLVWSTGNRVANAAVSGAMGPWKTIYLSDRLIQDLTPTDIEAVMCHEAGHVQRRHLLVRFAALALPMSLMLSIPTAHQLGANVSTHLASLGISHTVQVGVLLPVAVAVYAALVVLIASWIVEWDADLWAIQRLKSPGQLERALVHLAEEDPTRGRASWLHPSLEQRVRWIRWASQHPTAASRLQRIAAITAALLMSAGVALACMAQ